MEKWREHFMEMLGKNERMILHIEEEDEEGDRQRERMAEEEQEITREEVIETIKKLKKAKATEEDGIENEAWRFMQKDVGEEFVKLIDKIWKGEKIPEDWNKGMISPIFKKEKRNDLKNYRGVMLMNTAYKIYASILNTRLEKEVEKKLKEVQYGFRKKRGAINAIFMVNYAVNKKLR